MYSSYASWHGSAVVWYLVLGFVHELVHYIVYATLLATNTNTSSDNYFSNMATAMQSCNTSDFWFNLLIGRKFVWNPTDAAESSHGTTITGLTLDDMDIIRHSGWIASLVLALWIHHGAKKNDTCPLRWTAWVTAVEAIWTDLLLWPVIPTLLGPAPISSCFGCGNFGMILLHHAWWTHNGGGSGAGESVLNILEKLIEVTMMRGAQSGGVVCFHPKTHDSTEVRNGQVLLPSLYGVRSRIVNRKRTDLSVLVRRKVAQDNGFSSSGVPLRCPPSHLAFPKDFVPMFCGHTRFATSSKAALPDTHPQQWTPAIDRKSVV